jgi:hemoglobin
MKTTLRILLLAGITVASLSLSGAARADETLFDELGGKDGLMKIVVDFKDYYLADKRIADQFDNINLDRLTERLYDQFCELSGGPCHYPGRDMYASHKGLHINLAQFNALVEDLQFAMDKNDIPFRTQNKMVALLAPMKQAIVTR